ncbi:MAG: polysaccharide pyruvyl transferase family protein [Clostridia bacterium]|nr:polysaccharide pyruvyl transferase family protein [Clostridia bacterium]
MKVGIITYHNAINYGAALQALATQETVKGLGANAEIINYTPKVISDVYKPFVFSKYGRTFKRSIIEGVRSVLSDVYYFPFITRKNNAFKKFGDEFFDYSGKAFEKLETERESFKKYDVCFAGSDQIWNPDITMGFDPAYFLDFGKEDMVRAAYAASIGRDSFSEEEEQELTAYLEKFDFISSREATGAGVLRGMTDKTVETVLDPTLLLNSNTWEKVLNIKSGKGGYIFAYTLFQNEKLNEFVEKLSKEKNLPVVTINRRKIYSAEKQSFAGCDPKKFVELIANADYIVTNSFHGTAFSVNFSKNFITFKNSARNSRITDMLSMLGIIDRAVFDADAEMLKMPEIDYSSVQEKLQHEREMSINYIKTVLERAKP